MYELGLLQWLLESEDPAVLCRVLAANSAYASAFRLAAPEAVGQTTLSPLGDEENARLAELLQRARTEGAAPATAARRRALSRDAAPVLGRLGARVCALYAATKLGTHAFVVGA